jgi:hypothetical protein
MAAVQGATFREMTSREISRFDVDRRILFPGSARVSRAGFGVAPKRTFLAAAPGVSLFTIPLRKVREREEALASTRDACATTEGSLPNHRQVQSSL